MPNVILKPTVITSAGLGVLKRELTLANLVWLNPVGSFAGALNDTISVRVPAYATARSRALRSAAARTRDSIVERKVDVSLDTSIYKDVRITDEELTLDIADFGGQVLAPVMGAVGRSIDDMVAAEIVAAPYLNTVTYDLSDNAASPDPFRNIAVKARRFLNDAQVPFDGRVLLVGSFIESEFLGSDRINRLDASGSDSALRDATIGRVAGFDIVTSSAIDPNTAYAFHRSAFVLSQAAPVVPAGAPYGASMSAEGFAMRVVRVLDSATIEDILAVDSWAGTSYVPDTGYVDANGMFQPSEVVQGSAVTLATSAAADDIVDTATPHGLAVGDAVSFPTLTGGAGLVANRQYFVTATSFGASTFRPSATAGGAAIDFTTDITAGTVRKGGADLFVRGVKINTQA